MRMYNLVGVSAVVLISACTAHVNEPGVGDDERQTGGSGGSDDTDHTGGSGGGSGGNESNTDDATLLWYEDFESGNYDRWTSETYEADWNNGLCHDNGFSSEEVQEGSFSHRSDITCAVEEVHRGYGGLQFEGDTPLPAYTNSGQGIDAPHGIVNTYWSWIETTRPFADGRWFSFWTVTNDCGWQEPVITLGLEDASYVLTPAHIVNTGGTVDWADNRTPVPLGQWFRTTIYINFYEGEMAVWIEGEALLTATFTRNDNDICHFHWGAYADGRNDDVVLYEDNNALWKLSSALGDFEQEPLFDPDTQR